LNLNRKQTWLWITVIYTITTFIGSSVSKPPAFLVQKYRLDLWLHGIQYGLLALFVINYLSVGKPRNKIAGPATTTLLFCGIVGGLNEIFQVYVPNRFPSFSDEAANLIGAAIFIGLYFLFRPGKNGREKNKIKA